MKLSKGFVRIVAIVLAVLIVASVMVGVFSVGAYAAPSESDLKRLKDQQAQLAQEKREVQAQIDALEGEVTTALAKKSVIDEQLNLTTAEIDNITDQIAQYEILIVEKEDEVKQRQIEEEERYELYKARIRVMEENGTISYLSILFGAKSWTDLLARMDYIQEIMTYDESVYDNLVAARIATEEAKTALEEAKAESEETKASLIVKQDELAVQVAEAQAFIAGLEDDLSSYESLAAEQDALEKELLRDIEEMAAEIDRAKAAAAASSGSGSATGTGSFIWPSDVSRKVTSPYGTRVHPVHGTYRMHYGIDIGGTGYNANILAADSGTVVTSTYSSSYGNYVVITHGNGYRTLYAHMSKRLVSQGDEVSQGEVIGLVGSTGVSNGPHIHYEIIKNGEKINPLDFYSDYVKGW